MKDMNSAHLLLLKLSKIFAVLEKHADNHLTKMSRQFQRKTFTISKETMEIYKGIKTKT